MNDSILFAIMIILLIILIALVCYFNIKSNCVPNIRIKNLNFTFRDLQKVLNYSLYENGKLIGSYKNFSETLTLPESLDKICKSIDTFFNQVYERLPKAPKPYIYRLSLIGSDGSMLRDSKYPIQLYDETKNRATYIKLINSPDNSQETPLFRIGVFTNYFPYIDIKTHNGAIIWNSTFLQPINQRYELIESYISKSHGFDARLDINGKQNYFVTKLLQLNKIDKCVIRLSLTLPMDYETVLQIAD